MTRQIRIVFCTVSADKGSQPWNNAASKLLCRRSTQKECVTSSPVAWRSWRTAMSVSRPISRSDCGPGGGERETRVARPGRSRLSAARPGRFGGVCRPAETSPMDPGQGADGVLALQPRASRHGSGFVRGDALCFQHRVCGGGPDGDRTGIGGHFRQLRTSGRVKAAGRTTAGFGRHCQTSSRPPTAGA